MFILYVFALLASVVLGVNFDFENTQLTEAETFEYPAIRFSDPLQPSPQEECRYIPGDDNWPSDSEWALFNETLGGVLLKPLPLAISCYAGPLYDANKCAALQRSWTSMSQHANHPISVMSQWSSGMSCVPTNNPNSACSQGGYPVYVVDARTVRHVQMAVNFARNKNIRLVIKNSGHDFNGKSIGGGAISVWVHNLKGLTYHADYMTSGYNGRAIAIAGGTQASELSSASRMYNTTILNAGGPTVAVAGGYFQGAGHSIYASLFGLAADHVLQIRAVTANGQYIVADSETNQDLFWAFRGGGGGTFGIVTSIIVRTFATTPIASTSISFSTVPRSGQPALSNETFWAGLRAYWEYSVEVCTNKGFGYDFIRHASGSAITGFTFTTSISLPNRTTAELRAFTRPFLEHLNEIGIPVPIPRMQTFDVPNMQDESAGDIGINAIGDTVGNTLIASRLFQRSNYATPASISAMHDAIRSAIEEGGYNFHGQLMSPTLSVAGNPSNAILPAFRKAIMHTQLYERNAWWDSSAVVESAQQQVKRHDRLQSYMQTWRDLTPGGGSYMNEGDMQDPEWKQTFFGENYERLLAVKKEWDPEGVFWVISGVGSDEWELRGSSGGGRGGLFTQDGRLCRL